MDVHIVQRGDTLWKISRQYGISFEELKRVNAHLANPDYIVPGMKIFLPDKVQGKGEVSKASPSAVKKVEKVERIQKTEEPRGEQPIALSEALQAPQKPAPIPAMPKPPKVTSKPVQEKKPAPPKQTKPEVERPRPTPAPAPAPAPAPIDVATQVAPTPPPTHQPMPPMVPHPYPIPLIGIPCGWLPIYDADCYPFIHPGQMRPMPMMPSEPPMTQLPVPESSRFNHQRPRVPDQSKKPELTKSQKDERSQGLSYPTMPPKLNHSTLSVPEKMPMIESTSKPSPKPEMKPTPAPAPAPAPAPPEMQMQPVPEPMPYPDWSYQNNYPLHAGQSPCGCSQSAPMPLPMPMPMPVQHHPFCNACNQPLGAHSNHPMPYPAPYYWHGMY